MIPTSKDKRGQTRSKIVRAAHSHQGAKPLEILIIIPIKLNCSLQKRLALSGIKWWWQKAESVEEKQRKQKQKISRGR